MARPLRSAVAVVLCVSACASHGSAGMSGPMASAVAQSVPNVTVSVPDNGWPAEKQARHVLNRLAFGASPTDLADLRQLGVAGWITRQLQPERIDDSVVDTKLQSLETLQLSTAQLLERYPPLKGREPMMGEERPAYVAQQLAAARLIRAVESKRQLEEVLVDFWFNHFNVSAEKGAVKWMVTSYERDAIRPHVFGTFRELLGATAHHPAMLFYLDNWQSTREGGKRGLNENYARELMELHTLGVDGGYTQQDVHEVARAFTGWSIEKPREDASPIFRPRAHDRDPKTILGMTLPAGGGEEDGERVLDLLANHPSTAHFIALKLCRKFVSDTPPEELVQHVAKVFLQTHGDLRQVYAAVFSSPQFWSDEAYATKTKTPFELAASAIRALGGTTDGDLPLYRQVAKMGEPLYRAQPPTGYPEEASKWINAGALVNRINFGLALAHNRIRGTEVRLIPKEAPLGEARAEHATNVSTVVAASTSASATTTPPATANGTAHVAASAPVSSSMSESVGAPTNENARAVATSTAAPTVPATATAAMSANGIASGADTSEDTDLLIDALSRAILLTSPSIGTRATIVRAVNGGDEPLPDGEKRRPDPRLIAGLLLGSPEFQKQ